MAHLCGYADKGFHTAQTCGEQKKLKAFNEPLGLPSPSFYLEGKHAAEPPHLPLRQFMLGVALQTRIVDLCYLRMTLQKVRNFQRIFLMLPHPHR